MKLSEELTELEKVMVGKCIMKVYYGKYYEYVIELEDGIKLGVGTSDGYGVLVVLVGEDEK